MHIAVFCPLQPIIINGIIVTTNYQNKNRSMKFQTVKDTDKDVVVECINKAFFDYPVPISFTKDTLNVFFQTSNINENLSFCAFDEELMIGFILNSSNVYNGENVVFDAGTGVIPQYRGKGVFTSLYKHVEKELKNNGIKKYYLEVLQDNSRAISLYEKNGFSIVRSLSVYRAKGNKAKINNSVQFLPLSEFDRNFTQNCTQVKPSFEHSDNVIKSCASFYNVAYLQNNGIVSAFCIYDKASGRLIQLGYDDISFLKSILMHIAASYPAVTAKNIDTSFKEVTEALEHAGFNEIIKQYEMAKAL